MRVGTVIRLVSVAFIVGAPLIAPGMVVIRERRQLARLGPEIDPSDVAYYLAGRDGRVDMLLPEGVGGTRFHVEVRDGVAGVAYVNTATVVVTSKGIHDGEAVELHERAHLVHLIHPEVVEPLLAILPLPDSNTYAATNGHEHFAEMAATAWTQMRVWEVKDGSFCPAGTPTSMMEDAESRVPGTAAFIRWYAEVLEPSGYVMEPELLETAMRLSADYIDRWEPIAELLRGHRLDDGVMAAIEPRGIRESLLAGFRADRSSGDWFRRWSTFLYLPAITVAALID